MTGGGRRRTWHRERTAKCRATAAPALQARARVIAHLRRLPSDQARREYLNAIAAVVGLPPL